MHNIFASCLVLFFFFFLFLVLLLLLLLFALLFGSVFLFVVSIVFLFVVTNDLITNDISQRTSVKRLYINVDDLYDKKSIRNIISLK
jgi:hypothetical protein